MSKAFTREEDGTENLRLDDLPQSPHPNLVTPSGLASLQQRLTARRSALEELRQQGDGVDTAHAIAVAERDVRFLEERTKRAILVDPAHHNPGVVSFGAEVDVLTDDDTRQTFKIVGEDEAEPAKGLVAPFSPLGAALIGAEVGSTVEWKKPAGNVELEIVAIRFR